MLGKEGILRGSGSETYGASISVLLLTQHTEPSISRGHTNTRRTSRAGSTYVLKHELATPIDELVVRAASLEARHGAVKRDCPVLRAAPALHDDLYPVPRTGAALLLVRSRSETPRGFSMIVPRAAPPRPPVV